MAPKVPAAFVRKWNENTLHVLCPYCQCTHTHVTGDSYITFWVVESSCRINGYSGALEYFICYPGDEPAEARGLSYRVDKEKGHYITTGLPEFLDEDDEDWGEICSDTENEADVEDLQRFFADYETHPLIIESPPPATIDSIDIKLEKPLEDIPELVEFSPYQFPEPELSHSTTPSLDGSITSPPSTATFKTSSLSNYSVPSLSVFGHKGLSACPPLVPRPPRAGSRLSKRSSWQEERLLFFTYCMENNVDGLKLLFTFPAFVSFMDSLDDHGRSGLLLAAQNDARNAIIFLFSKGADLNSIGPNGRTALMEASLWGCEISVKMLIQLGADIHTKDHHGHTAFDLSRPRPRNSSERRQRGGTNDKKSDKCRAEISMYLRMLMYASHLGERSNSPVFLDRNIQTFSNAYSDKAKTCTLSQKRTFDACLDWPLNRNSSPLLDDLDDNLYSKKAHQLAQLIGFSTSLHYSGRGLPKMNSHCHVERQLVARFIEEHVIVPGEPGWFGSGWHCRASEAQGDMSDLSSLEMLSTVRPRCHMLKARILVNREPCNDCVRFVHAVNRALGVDIRLKLAASHEILQKGF